MLTQFLSSVQLFKQKILDVGTRIAGVEKYARKTTVASDGGNLCPLWLVILKSVCYSFRDTGFKKSRFNVSFWTSILANKYFETRKSYCFKIN